MKAMVSNAVLRMYQLEYKKGKDDYNDKKINDIFRKSGVPGTGGYSGIFKTLIGARVTLLGLKFLQELSLWVSHFDSYFLQFWLTLLGLN